METVPSKKLALRYFIIASLIGYAGTLDFAAAKGFKIYPFGYLSFTCFELMVAYTLLRHQFLEVNLLIRKISLISFIYTLLFAIFIPLSMIVVKKFLGGPNPNLTGIMLSLAVFLGLIFSSGPLIYAFLVQHTFWLRSNMGRGLTHELKSPLSLIQSLAELMESKIKKGTFQKEEFLQYIQLIQKHSTRLENFTTDLLNVAQIEGNDYTLTKEWINITDIIETEAHVYTPLARQKGMTLALSLDKNCRAECDPAKIKQVISNLISNALNYSTSGEIHISLKNQKDGLLCTIKDAGRGISKTDLPQVFDRYFQGKKISKGSGIGLTIAKGWIETHGGKIWAESEGEGRGSVFMFTLPVS